MGAWGLGTFDDDIACDWLEDLGESDTTAFFRVCLDLRGHGDLEYVACVGVLCTAEMIHALLCGPRDGLPGAANEWLRKSPVVSAEQLVPSAIEGLKRILDNQSAMHQLWEDSNGSYQQWIDRVTDLADRLGDHQRDVLES
jgi:hypothetical protein